MKLTKNIITRERAIELAPTYVAYVEDSGKTRWDKLHAVTEAFDALKRGQSVVTFHDGQYVLAKVSQIANDDPRAVDGPLVRVSNGEYSWRVDGNGYAAPVVIATAPGERHIPKLTERLRLLILQGTKAAASYDPDMALSYVEEMMTMSEIDRATKFLTWVNEHGKAFGHGTLDNVWLTAWTAIKNAPTPAKARRR